MNLAKIIVLLGIFILLLNSVSAEKVGMNLGILNEWEPQIMFNDVFNQIRPFDTAGREFGGAGSGCLDSEGWPTQSPCNGSTAQTLIFSGTNFDHPLGTYTLKFKGSGTITLSGGATGTFSTPGTYSVSVTTLVPIQFTFTSNASDPIRDIDFILPGHENDYLTKPFYPNFIDQLKGVKSIRLMDTFSINDSPLTSWAERHTLNSQTQSGWRGIAPEYAAMLANELHSNLWLNVPHQADDNYVSELAKVMKQNLNPDLNIYLEYSNEVWNALFSQYNYATQQGQALGFGQASNLKFIVYRSSQIKYLFRQEFSGEEERIKLVLGQQFSTVSNTEKMLSFTLDPTYNPTGESIYALAVAPYNGLPTNLIYQNNLENSLTTSQIIDMLIQNLTQTDISIPGFSYTRSFSLEELIVDNKEVADSYGIELMAYEGGQALVANQNGVPSNRIDILTGKFTLANEDPGMKTMYDQMLAIWFGNGGELYNHYKFISRPDKYGAWGLKEWQDQNASDSPLAPKWQSFSAYFDTNSDSSPSGCVDEDNDGYYLVDSTYCQEGNDCDDSSSTIHPGASDYCEDGIDQDCSRNELGCLKESSNDTNNSTDSNASDSENSSNSESPPSDSNDSVPPAITPDVNRDVKSVCGDGICSKNESGASCAKDCAAFNTEKCGNGVCESFENVKSCSLDCSICGDNICSGKETPLTCSQDCNVQKNLLPVIGGAVIIILVFLGIIWRAMTKKSEE